MTLCRQAGAPRARSSSDTSAARPGSSVNGPDAEVPLGLPGPGATAGWAHTRVQAGAPTAPSQEQGPPTAGPSWAPGASQSALTTPTPTATQGQRGAELTAGSGDTESEGASGPGGLAGLGPQFPCQYSSLTALLPGAEPAVVACSVPAGWACAGRGAAACGARGAVLKAPQGRLGRDRGTPGSVPAQPSLGLRSTPPQRGCTDGFRGPRVAP